MWPRIDHCLLVCFHDGNTCWVQDRSVGPTNPNLHVFALLRRMWWAIYRCMWNIPICMWVCLEIWSPKMWWLMTISYKHSIVFVFKQNRMGYEPIGMHIQPSMGWLDGVERHHLTHFQIWFGGFCKYLYLFIYFMYIYIYILRPSHVEI